MHDQPLPPGLLLRSFLNVGSGFVMVCIAFMLNAYLLGRLFFPEYLEFFDSDAEIQKQILENDPSSAIPNAMVFSLIVLQGLVCFLIGWIAVRTAPFAHFAHAIFLAVLTFAFFLQIVIEDPPPKKWMDVCYMG